MSTTTTIATGPHAEPYPRFSGAELERRRALLAAAMAARGVDHVVAYGADRSGSAVAWLTRWPVTRQALVVHTPGERDALLVDFYNHIPNATRIADGADVGWIGPDAIGHGLGELRRRGAAGARVGVIGSLPHAARLQLAELAGEVVEMSGDYARLRLVKSPEELDWLRVGCELTDRAVLALRDGARPGMTEAELGALVEAAYLADGGRTHIHYFSATPMDDPRMSVPAQWPSTRRLAAGDALVCEISATFWDHPGQLLRTFAVAAEPTEEYRALHDVADAALDAILARVRDGATAAELVEAAGVIEEAGLTIRDDLVHGFVGGYLPPVLGSASRMLTPVPDFTLKAGMTIVVQPNVVTPDERVGVQTGELVLVTERGAERLHNVERGLLRIGGR